MKNQFYTIFVTKTTEADAVLLVETKDAQKAKDAKAWAISEGYTITREYTPETELSNPNFAKAINL